MEGLVDENTLCTAAAASKYEVGKNQYLRK